MMIASQKRKPLNRQINFDKNKIKQKLFLHRTIGDRNSDDPCYCILARRENNLDLVMSSEKLHI